MSSILAPMVYILAALTSLASALLLARGYRRSRYRLLLWSSLFFAALSLDNVILFFDLIVIPNIDVGLVTWRHVVTLIGQGLLLVGLIWESE